MRSRSCFVVLAILIAMFLTFSSLALARDSNDRNKADRGSARSQRDTRGKVDGPRKNDRNIQQDSRSQYDRPRAGSERTRQPDQPKISNRDRNTVGNRSDFGRQDQSRIPSNQGTIRRPPDNRFENPRPRTWEGNGSASARPRPNFDRNRRIDQNKDQRQQPGSFQRHFQPTFRPEQHRPMIRRDFDREYDRNRSNHWSYGYRWRERRHFFRSDSSWLPWTIIVAAIIIADNERHLSPSEYAKRHYTWFYSQEEAYDQFKANFSDIFDNSFQHEPHPRAWWVPYDTFYRGHQFEIEFDEDAQEYGCFDNSGAFIKYDVWDDDNNILKLMIAKRYLWPGWESYR